MWFRNKKITALFLTMFFLIPQSSKAANNNQKPFIESNPPKTISLQDKPSVEKNGAAKTINRPRYIPNEIIVRYKKSGNKITVRNEIVKNNSLKVKKSIGSLNTDLLTIDSGSTVEGTINKLKGNSDIELVQPNYLYFTEDFSLDSRENELWGLENIGQTIQGHTGIEDIDIDIKGAWNVTQGSNEIVVGVIDTGIDINHPELKDNIWINKGEIPNNNIDDDKDGYIDDVNGWDFYNNDNTVFDEKDSDEHGTHVAGIIGASLNNSGIVGVSPIVKIMPLKFIGPYGGDTLGAIKAIEYAKNKGVKIMNGSWGGGEYDQALKDAIGGSGSLFVAAAGNEDLNNDIYKTYPASFDSANLISVAAIDNQGDIASFSNYGQNSVHVAAPGVNILSTMPKIGNLGAAVGSKNGTSNTMVQGFDLNYIDVSQQQDMVGKIAEYLELQPGDPILVVSDDERSIYSNKYLFYLKQLGYSNSYGYTVNYMGDGPTLSDLSPYKAVFWIIGSAYHNMLTNNDQQNLVGYIAGGGKVFLSGNFLSFENYTSNFFKTYFHTNFLHNASDKTVLTGNSQGVFSNQTYTIQDVPSDFMEPSDSKGETLLYYQGKGDYNNLYAYKSGTSMAAPFVTGIAALLMSKDVSNPLILKAKLMEGTEKLSYLSLFVSTSGLVNAYNALMRLKDVNGDSFVNIQDLALLGKKYNITSSSSNFNTLYDYNEDKIIDLYDLVILSKDLNN